MSAAAIINLALGLLQVVLSNLKSGSVSDELQVVIDGIEGAVESLQSVKGTPVTFAQLESLRVEPKW
jgi:hypothetical protein